MDSEKIWRNVEIELNETERQLQGMENHNYMCLVLLTELISKLNDYQRQAIDNL